MDHQTRKLVAEALLNAASTLSALTDRRLEYVLPGLEPRDQQSVLWIVFNAIGLERRVTPSIIGFVIDGKRFPMSEKDKEGYKVVLDYLKDDLAKNTVVDAYIPWLANQFKKGNVHASLPDGQHAWQTGRGTARYHDLVVAFVPCAYGRQKQGQTLVN